MYNTEEEARQRVLEVKGSDTKILKMVFSTIQTGSKSVKVYFVFVEESPDRARWVLVMETTAVWDVADFWKYYPPD